MHPTMHPLVQTTFPVPDGDHYTRKGLKCIAKEYDKKWVNNYTGDIVEAHSCVDTTMKRDS